MRIIYEWLMSLLVQCFQAEIKDYKFRYKLKISSNLIKVKSKVLLVFAWSVFPSNLGSQNFLSECMRSCLRLIYDCCCSWHCWHTASYFIFTSFFFLRNNIKSFELLKSLHRDSWPSLRIADNFSKKQFSQIQIKWLDYQGICFKHLQEIKKEFYFYFISWK